MAVSLYFWISSAKELYFNVSQVNEITIVGFFMESENWHFYKNYAFQNVSLGGFFPIFTPPLCLSLSVSLSVST